METIFCMTRCFLSSFFLYTAASSLQWFGPNNMYVCRCQNDTCDVNGRCLVGSTCVKGWFGPDCQYQDLAYNTINQQSPQLTDGDDSTCLNSNNEISVTLRLIDSYPFSWMRIVISRPDLLPSLTAYIGTSGQIMCSNVTTNFATLDIYCDCHENVSEVVLSGIGVGFICSIYISGGRNVALNQNTSQSGSYSDKGITYGPERSVDGNTNGYFVSGQSCSHTAEVTVPYTPWWTITFQRPQIVHRYIIYNRIDSEYNRNRIIGFSLRSFGENGSLIYNYSDPFSNSTAVYNLTDLGTNPLKSATISVNNSDSILNMCEVELYGDAYCNNGTYGRECDKTCNCLNNSFCFVSTGSCPTGCKLGYYGEDCQTACAGGWFGRQCQYKCRCTNNNCDQDGQCSSGAVCLEGWFGPACQYVDLAYNSSNPVTDGNDTTCLSSQSSPLTISLKANYNVTWIRVRVSTPDAFKSLQFHFGSSQREICDGSRNITVDKRTLDFFCTPAQDVSMVTFNGEAVGQLCSVYVSGGRNVALRQYTTQSSTYSSSSIQYPSSNAVDGNTNGSFTLGNSCSCTLNGDNTNWIVSFDRAYSVGRYLIYNREPLEGTNRLSTFILRSAHKNGTIVFDHTEKSSNMRIYTVTSAEVPIVQVTIFGNNADKLTQVCEVEVYGDTVCNPGRYGIECEYICNCADHDNTCFVGTGGCPDGCAPGFYGESCHLECTDDKFGISCRNSCSENCEAVLGTSRTCDRFNGTCSAGCKSGFTGPPCTEPCPEGTYGLQCLLNCSSNCRQDQTVGTTSRTCDPVNGTCLFGCESGYTGAFCNQTCDKYSYGQQCLGNCSVHCKDDQTLDSIQRACDLVSGTCLQGCEVGYVGTFCNETCPKDLYGPECNSTCTSQCLNSNDTDESPCHYISGTCLFGCDSGYTGDFCNQTCPNGNFGPQCNGTCSANCVPANERSCDNVNGMCLFGCQPGYTGLWCNNPCSGNLYGTNCSSNCNTQCAHNETTVTSCHHVDGSCLFGCQPGFKSSHCDEGQIQMQKPSDDNVVVPAVVTTLAVLAIIAVILGIFLYRRRQHKKAAHKPPVEMDENLANTYSNIQTEAIPYKNMETGPGDIELQVAPVPSPKPRIEGKKKIAKKEDGTQNGELKGVYYNTVAAKDTEVTAIPLKSLSDFLNSKDREFFQNQFNSIPANTSATTEIGMNAENRNKNRYKNIAAYDHSRVHLIPNADKIHGDYINASYVDGFKSDEKFIASQGPTKVILKDFVRMLWEQKVDKVVMLTNLVEDGKQKAERYWPEEGEMKVGEITVKLTTTQVFADYTIRRLQLKKEDSPGQNLTHFHFTTWPDKDVPSSFWGLVDFEQRVALDPTKKPVVVHCSAGVGRTGTFIALRNVMRQAEETGEVDFFQAVKTLRRDRINMVQTVDQYIFLHQATLVARLCMGSTLTLANASNGIEELEAETIGGKSKLDLEFESMCAACQVNMEETSTAETNPANVYENSANFINKSKNRDSSVVPSESNRAHLASELTEFSDYINAVLVPSLNKPNHQILTQLPLPTTVTDFWRLVTQYQVSLVVALLDQAAKTDESVCDYRPLTENEQKYFSLFSIKTEHKDKATLWSEEKITVTVDTDKINKSTFTLPIRKEHTLRHVTCHLFDLDHSHLLSIAEHVRSLNSGTEGKTLFMCRNGASLSGLVCVLCHLLNRLDIDHQVTVPLIVGSLKTIRPQIVPTVDQYRLLYRAIQLYRESANEYTNFKRTNPYEIIL